MGALSVGWTSVPCQWASWGQIHVTLQHCRCIWVHMQASAIVEALEVGATTLLIDEDTAATNFMIRDARMERLVKSDPITPFIHRVRRSLQRGVVGLGCRRMWRHFEVADLIICMEDYLPRDATQEAKSISSNAARQQLKCCGRATPIRACNHKGHHGTVFESRRGQSGG